MQTASSTISCPPLLPCRQAEASEQLGTLLPRERHKQAYNKALLERYKHMDEVRRITHQRNLPKAISKATKQRRVIVDAEQTWLQPAIDVLALRAMREFNRPSSSSPSAPRPSSPPAEQPDAETSFQKREEATSFQQRMEEGSSFDPEAISKRNQLPCFSWVKDDGLIEPVDVLMYRNDAR